MERPRECHFLGSNPLTLDKRTWYLVDATGLGAA